MQNIGNASSDFGLAASTAGDRAFPTVLLSIAPMMQQACPAMITNGAWDTGMKQNTITPLICRPLH